MMQVLILDDNAELCKFLEVNLQENSIDAKAVSNSADALHLLKNEKFQALIIDTNLQDGDGLSFVAKVRENRAGKSIPVVLMADYDTSLARRVAADSGCNAFLPKPFTTTQLLDLLRGLLA